jgi:uncharacterized protein with HEPN domain
VKTVPTISPLPTTIADRLAHLDADTAERLGPDQQIIALRNVLIHGYDLVDHERVWHVIHNDLPTRLTQAEQLLEEVDTGNK